MKIKENLSMSGKLKTVIRDAETGFVKRTTYYNNVICTVGKSMIADNLTNASPDNVMRINYVALGSDATAPVASDATLGTETYRNTVASETNSDNIAYISAFFGQTEVTGTFAEAGLFSDGGAGADSGILVSHVAISETKSAVETLTIDWQITIN